jgi:hypothetical protein
MAEEIEVRIGTTLAEDPRRRATSGSARSAARERGFPGLRGLGRLGLRALDGHGQQPRQEAASFLIGLIAELDHRSDRRLTAGLALDVPHLGAGAATA